MRAITPLQFGPTLCCDPQYENRWFLVDEQQRSLSATACASLDALTVRIHFGQLQFAVEGMLRLEIPLDVLEDDDEVRRIALDESSKSEIKAIDEGGLAAVWFSNVLGRPCLLYKKDTGRPVEEG